MPKFEINVRRTDDYVIKVDTAEVARLLQVNESVIIKRLTDARRTNTGDDVMMSIMGLHGALATKCERDLAQLTDRVVQVELHEPGRVTWTKTDRVIDSIVLTEA